MPIDPYQEYPAPSTCEYCGQEVEEGTVCEECRSLHETAHEWEMAGDEPDIFAYASGYHNGPRCNKCGYYFCQHCNPEGWKTSCGSAAIAGDDRKLDRSIVAFDTAIRGTLGLPPVK